MWCFKVFQQFLTTSWLYMLVNIFYAFFLFLLILSLVNKSATYKKGMKLKRSIMSRIFCRKKIKKATLWCHYWIYCLAQSDFNYFSCWFNFRLKMNVNYILVIILWWLLNKTFSKCMFKSSMKYNLSVQQCCLFLLCSVRQV